MLHKVTSLKEAICMYNQGTMNIHIATLHKVTRANLAIRWSTPAHSARSSDTYRAWKGIESNWITSIYQAHTI